MSIVKMKKLSLLAVTAQREALLKELMLLGCVEVSQSRCGEDESALRLTPAESPDLAALRTRFAQLNTALRLLDTYAPRRSPLLAPLPDVRRDTLLSEEAVKAAVDLAEQIISLDDSIRRDNGEESRERALMEALAPWSELDMPIEYSGTEHSSVLMGSFPATLELDEADAALADAAPESQLFRVSDDKYLHYTVLVALSAELDAALGALRPLGFTAAALGDGRGSPRQLMAEGQKRLDALESHKGALSTQLAAMGDSREELKLRCDTLSTMIARGEAQEKLLCTERVSLLTGWVPAEKEAALGEILKKYDCAWETSDPEPEEAEQVPVKLKNNRLTRCLNMVTGMYSLPAYNGVDPNPLMAPFFILFYGIMMADMGYGLLMMIAGAVVLAKAKPREGMRNFCELLLYCGISTFIWGALTGGFFGDAIYQVVKIINPQSAFTGLPALFSPLNDTVMILIGSMALGFVQIVTGMAISFVEKLKNREYLDAIFEELTWWVVFAGIGCMVLGAGNYVLYAGIALVVIGPLVMNKGFGKVTGIFGSLYNHVTGFFGDILSYSRLMALMLAGSVIAQVFNTIGAIPGNLIVFFIVSIIGNSLNFALNLLGCYVHDLRLQCLEYFNKFYKDGGRPFEPMAINTKYYNIDIVNN